MSKQYNIHRILNDFEKYFKHKRLETKVTMIHDQYIDIQAIYAKNQRLDETNTDPDWTEREPVGEKRDYADCYVMISLQPKRIMYPTGADPWRLILYPHKIYINPYTCPDINLAHDFMEAKKQFDQQLKEKSYEIKLDKKMLAQARQKIFRAMKSEYEAIVEYGNTSVTDEYFKDSQLEFLNMHMNNMRNVLNVMQFLLLGTYGSGNPELDSYFINETSMNHLIDNPDFALYTKSASKTGERVIE